VVIYANSTIGTDGFGYRLVDGRHRKIPHIGIVVIEDDVEIGSNSCVDRAKFGRTIVGRGTKIDNLVQIAHNVKIGENCIIVAQTGIAGSAELGRYVVLGGQCAIADHVKIGDGVMAGATTGVNRDIEPGAKILGAPARPIREFFREVSLIQKLPELTKEVKKLREDVKKYEGTKDNS
jgi:UDP-3-O-[3-hydroxymyristoyl] glucosamine N-acyltransferase